MSRNWASPIAVMLALLFFASSQYASSAPEPRIVVDSHDAERAMVAKLLNQVNGLNEEILGLRAMAKLGKGESTVLELLSQMKELKDYIRGLQDGASLERNEDKGLRTYSKGVVESVLIPERVVLISRGRASGVLEGAVIRLGAEGVLAKVVESRSNVSAAAVENSYKGKLADLVGCTAELSAR